MPLNRGSVDRPRRHRPRPTIHMARPGNASEAEFPVGREMQRRIGHHAVLAVPLMREDRAIGAIALWRMEARRSPTSRSRWSRPSPTRRRSRSRTCACSTRRRRRSSSRPRSRNPARDLELARPTSSRSSMRSPSARLRLCGALGGINSSDRRRTIAAACRIEGGVARRSRSHDALLPISRDSISGRAILEHTTIHVHDVLGRGGRISASARRSRADGQSATLLVDAAVPRGQPFGTILLRRNEVRPFTEREIALLKTFGDQAAIAIENVRLFNETKEALDQQRASGEMLAAISELDRGHDAGVRQDPRRAASGCSPAGSAVDRLIGDDGLRPPRRLSRPVPELVEQFRHVCPTTTSRSRASAIRARVARIVRDMHVPSVAEYPRRELGVQRSASRRRSRADAVGRQGHRRDLASRGTMRRVLATRRSRCSRPSPTRR